MHMGWGVGGCMLYDGCVYGAMEADPIASVWKGGGEGAGVDLGVRGE